MDPVAFGKMIFYICMVPLVFFSLKFYIFGALSMFINQKRKFEEIPEDKLPKVSIHIPVYNDSVVVNCVRDCLNFDYPKDKMEVIVIDDSTDETVELLDSLHRENKNFTILRRGSRRGFKAGALNDATKISKGDIIVIFDSDYRPKKDFLKKIVQPFVADEKVAFVQTRWDYLNPAENYTSKIASICFNAFHKCSMPIKEMMGTALFCGSGGAVRKNVLVEIGGWNEDSITEDLDMTVRVLDKGYKQVYLPYVASRGEVPSTLKAFVRQQQRWAYGTTKVLRDYFSKILFSKKLSTLQKFDLILLSSGFLVFPFILGVTLSTYLTMAPWFGPPLEQTLFDVEAFMESLSKALSETFSPLGISLLILGNGYLVYCAIALAMDKNYGYIKYIPLLFGIGLVMQFTNTIAVVKAFLGLKHQFYKTPKVGVNLGDS